MKHPSTDAVIGEISAASTQSPSSPLDNRFDRVAPTTFIPRVPAQTLSSIFRAMRGISAITQIIIASGVEEDMDGGMPLAASTAGNLLAGAQALVDYALHDIESIADWSDCRANEGSEVSHGR
jgi:hypothetical protein